jgi:hypothetical protein
VPHCGDTVAVAYLNSSLSITNWISHTFNNHPHVLTAADYEKKKNNSKKKRGSTTAEGPVAVSRGEEKEALSELICTNGLPLSFADSLGWKQYCTRHGIETFARRTITEHIKDIEKSKVIEPRNKALREYFAIRPVNFGDVHMKFRLKCSIGLDGWTDRQGRQMESTTICMAILQITASGIVMVPNPLPGMLDHWKLQLKESSDDEDEGRTKGLYYDAQQHADFVVESLSAIDYGEKGAKVCLSIADVLKVNTDTTNGQPSMVEKLPRDGGVANLDSDIERGYPEMTGSFYSECVSHTVNLMTSDLKKCSIFDDVHKISNDLSVWLRASDKRMQVFRDSSAKAKPGISIRKPVSFPVTRFFYAVLQMKILCEAFPVLEYIYSNSCFGDDDNETKTEFNDMFTTYASRYPTAIAIVKLFEKQLAIAPKLGAARTYTNSLPGKFFFTLLEHIDSFASTTEGKRILPVIEAFKCSLFGRTASVSVLQSGLKAKLVPSSSPFYNADFFKKWKESNQYIRRVYRDDIVNAAAYLDPAVHRWYDVCGHNLLHAKTFFVRLLKGCIVSDDDDVEEVPEDTNQTTIQLREAYKREKNIITKRQAPWMVDLEMFKQDKKDDLARLIPLRDLLPVRQP